VDPLNRKPRECWPRSAEELTSLQRLIGSIHPASWQPPPPPVSLIAAFVCFSASAGTASQTGWACAVAARGRRVFSAQIVSGTVDAPYQPGLLAMREGRLLERAVRAVPAKADVLLVNATGRDHPRRAGLAVHLGWVLDVPTIGVTDRPLVASADEPGLRRGDVVPLILDEEIVGYRVRTRTGARPVIAHAGWRTTPEAARDIVLTCIRKARTPEPTRRARRLARLARATAGATA
jgi:deoxyribonuclease V